MTEAISYAARRAARVGIVGTIIVLAAPACIAIWNALWRLL